MVSSSQTAVQPVLETVVASAARLCEAQNATIHLRDGDVLVPQAQSGPLGRTPLGERLPLSRRWVTGRAVLEARTIHVPDLLASDDYPEGKRMASSLGHRATLVVPLLREAIAIGAILLRRREAHPFTEKQIALVQNFAAQVVIAIENARLLSELRESLEQQTAVSEVLNVISSSPGELQPVFRTILENASRLCEANFGILNLYDSANFPVVAMHNVPDAFAQWRRREPLVRPGSTHVLARVAETKRLLHVTDMKAQAEYIAKEPPFVALVDGGGARTLLIVPMLKNEQLLGTVSIYRQEVRPFTDKQIALLENFAAQAVIAIENARLLNELRQRTNDLTQSLEDLRTAQDRLVQTEKLASLGQLTAGIAHEIKNPLNFVNNFSGLSVELIDELAEGLKGLALDDKQRAEFAELTETLRANLQKVVQHGKRADSIVKNMLLHSREGSGERRLVNVNALVEESLNLAYHGARAEKQGFTITLEQSFDPEAGQADVFPQEITRVLLNLISNGFYAATKRQGEADNNSYEPVLMAATRNLGDRVEIRIRDNGTGIPPEVKEKMFNPFFTTKPAGEGTGLGLSISHDIIVKQHLGSIEVDSAPGEFTEIRIVLPRTTGLSSKPGE